MSATNEFKNRVFGAVIIKSVNSNFNADFTGHPRTLPDGTVYATDKALKYAVKDFIRKNYGDKTLFYVKRLNDSLNPLTLDETYEELFKEYPTAGKKVDKKAVLANILSCLDIRLFGATFAGKTNISIHGPVQINHGVNKFPENEIYTEDILSPFRNPGKEKSKGKEEEEEKEKAMSTIGNQTNLKEGHYVYHFTINPKNTKELYKIIADEKLHLSYDDIVIFKEALNAGVTALDSTRKINCENEAMLWVQLTENSKKVLPNFTELITVNHSDDSLVEIDFTKVFTLLEKINSEIEAVELYYNPVNTTVTGIDILTKDLLKTFDIITQKELS